nr:hypothetical protein [Tanacetum cinerariifolium]
MGQFGQITHTHTYDVPFHTRKLFTTLRVNSPSFSGRIVPFFDSMLVPQGEGLGTPTEPYHTPSTEAQQTSPTTHSSPSLLLVTTEPLSTVIPSNNPPLRQYARRARIAQSSALPHVADEHASPIGDDNQGEACPTISSLEVDQDMTNITKTSTLPSDSTPRVTSLAADEGSMQQKLDELTALCTSLQRQQSEMVSKFEAQELEINSLKAIIKLLKDKDGGVAGQSGDDAPIKGRRLDEGEEAAERVNGDIEEMATVLTSMDAASILTSGGVQVVPTTAEVATATSIPHTQEGKMARQLEEEMVRDAQRMNEQIAKDAKIARIHVEEELQIMIDGLDRNNETVAKYLQEYHQFAIELPIGRRIKLISDLVKYQDNYAIVLKYQTQQRKPLTKKQQKEFYTSVLRNQAGWKAKHFKGMTLEEIKEKFDPVWKQIQDFIPVGSKEESERLKRKGIRFEQDIAKKQKTSEEVLEEKLKEMIELIPIEEVYVEALQVKHPIIDWKVHTEGQRSYWKIIRLGGSSASYQFFVDMLNHFDKEDLNQLWGLVKENLSIRPAAIEWKLYDTCGVHHVIFKDQEIFMLVEKDYPLRKGLALVMICYKLHVDNYSQMANDLILKIYKIANSPRQQDD